MLLANRQSRELDTNRRAQKLLCMTADQLDGQLWAGINAGLSLVKWKEYIKELGPGKSLSQEASILTGKDQLHPVTAHYYAIKDDQILILLEDKTSAVQQKERLSLGLLELFPFSLHRSSDLILWVRSDGAVVFANDSFFKRTGFPESEILGQSVVPLFPASTEEKRRELWDQLRQKGTLRKEVAMMLNNGESIPVQATLHYVRCGEEEYDCLHIRDWEKKNELDRSIYLSKMALKETRDGVIWLEEDLRVWKLNRAVLEMLGETSDYWKGKKMQEVFPGLELKDFADNGHKEIELASREGHTVHLELSFTSITYGQQIYYLIVARNFTERYYRRRSLQEARKKIQELTDRLQEENVLLREEIDSGYDVDNIVTVSPAYRKVLKQVSKVADTDTTVLITGETGTGKELLARAIHRLSNHSERPLIKVNCAALPEHLIESELFGHEKGAFTGAIQRKKGRFEQAHQGTIFLDEVGELPLNMQAKLLRVLQEGEFERVGGAETLRVEARVIAATNRKLEKAVEEGRFRSDLYYRLNVFQIDSLPLRERPEDIPVLVDHFVRKYAGKLNKKIEKINSGDLKKLERYHFPGNVRELENIIERAVVLCESNTLRVPLEEQNGTHLDPDSDRFLTFDEMQRAYILKALKKTNGRISGPQGAGRVLGLNDRTLMSKIRKFKIKKEEYLG